MSAALRVGVALPQTFGSARVDARLVTTAAVEIEALGFDGIWVQEDVLTRSGTLDALISLAYAAALTTRVDLGTAVLIAPLYDPVHLAKQIATLDQLSGGRLIVGVGLGGDSSQYPAYGVPSEHRAQRFEAVVCTMRALWEGQLDSPAPALFDLNGAMMEPRPRQDHIALWFGGHAPGALRRATSLGNGFIAGGGSTSDEFASAAQSLRKAAGPSFTIAKRVYIACSDHVSDAEQRLLRWLDDYYGDSSLSPRVAVAGDVATCLDKLRVLVEAGADYLILNFVFDEIASIRGAARDFLPVLRDWSTSVLRG